MDSNATNSTGIPRQFDVTRLEEMDKWDLPQPSAFPLQTLAQRKQAVEAQIDDFMRKVGYADPAVRTDEEGWRWFALGSAEGRAGVIEKDGELFLRVEALIMGLPSDKELILPLMRELLEINMSIADPGRVGIRDEAVFATITRPVPELRPDDFAKCIHSVMVIADSMDDDLIAKYGGTSKKRSGIDSEALISLPAPVVTPQDHG